MCTEEEPVVKCSLGSGEVFKEIERLFGRRALSAVEGYTPLYCFSKFIEVYLLTAELVSAVERVMSCGRVPYAAGLYAGRLRTGRPAFIPSHLLIEKVYRVLEYPRRAVALAEDGVKAVLYGRDVLRESVVKCFDPLESGEVLAVLGLDGYVYAIALSNVEGCGILGSMKPADVIAKTVFDLGWYLRGGTYPRESKYRL